MCHTYMDFFDYILLTLSMSVGLKYHQCIFHCASFTKTRSTSIMARTEYVAFAIKEVAGEQCVTKEKNTTHRSVLYITVTSCQCYNVWNNRQLDSWLNIFFKLTTKYKTPPSWPFVRGIHRWTVVSLTNSQHELTGSLEGAIGFLILNYSKKNINTYLYFICIFVHMQCMF